MGLEFIFEKEINNEQVVASLCSVITNNSDFFVTTKSSAAQKFMSAYPQSKERVGIVQLAGKKYHVMISFDKEKVMSVDFMAEETDRTGMHGNDLDFAPTAKASEFVAKIANSMRADYPIISCMFSYKDSQGTNYEKNLTWF